jgi:hypothetical protein
MLLLRLYEVVWKRWGTNETIDIGPRIDTTNLSPEETAEKMVQALELYIE